MFITIIIKSIFKFFKCAPNESRISILSEIVAEFLKIIFLLLF